MAFRLARMASVLSKAKFAGPIIFKFGQVDVEFVYDFHRTQVRQIEFDERHWRAYLNKSVENYVVFVAEHFRQLSCRAVGIFPPALADDVLKSGYANAHVAATEGVADLSELVNSLRTLEFPDKVHRTLLHREFNQMLKRRANEAGVPYFDDFGFFLGGDGLLDYAFIPTHRGTDHHLERQATRTVAIRIITKIFSEIGVT